MQVHKNTTWPTQLKCDKRTDSLRFRTTAFKSGSATDPNGNVGISMHLSMHSNSDIENLKFLTALFLVEVEMFYSQIK